MSDESRKLLALDWMHDLREFPAEAVQYACAHWRRTQARKPTIADIRGLCATEPEAEGKTFDADDYARQQGFTSAADHAEALRKHQAERDASYRAADQWRRDNPYDAALPPAPPQPATVRAQPWMRATDDEKTYVDAQVRRCLQILGKR